MQIENFNIKIGRVENAESTEKKGMLRLKEYKKPFYFFGKSKLRLKELNKDEFIAVVRKDKFNWFLFPNKCQVMFSSDGSQKKYLWFTSVEEKYQNGFFARVGNKRIFFNSEEDVKIGEWLLIEINEDNFPTYVEQSFCMIPNNLYRKVN